MSMALFSSPPTNFPLSSSSSKTHFHFLSISSNSNTNFLQLSSTSRTTDNVSRRVISAASVQEKISEAPTAVPVSGKANGSALKSVAKFEDPKWVSGTWNLTKFQKEGKTDWDAVIDSEVRRRKWLEDNPESNNDPVVFESSIIPWWSWVKRFHLPEAELLNGRAAMIGFFMTYLVDSLTGAGVVDQMGNFFCKMLLFGTVAGVLLIRKNEDLENIKKFIEETTSYDRQWQATWKDETSSMSNKV